MPCFLPIAASASLAACGSAGGSVGGGERSTVPSASRLLPIMSDLPPVDDCLSNSWLFIGISQLWITASVFFGRRCSGAPKGSEPKNKPCLEKVPVTRILDTVVLDRQGTINAAAARRLIQMKYHFEEAVSQHREENPEPMVRRVMRFLNQIRTSSMTDRALRWAPARVPWLVETFVDFYDWSRRPRICSSAEGAGNWLGGAVARSLKHQGL